MPHWNAFMWWILALCRTYFPPVAPFRLPFISNPTQFIRFILAFNAASICAKFPCQLLIFDLLSVGLQLNHKNYLFILIVWQWIIIDDIECFISNTNFSKLNWSFIIFLVTILFRFALALASHNVYIKLELFC